MVAEAHIGAFGVIGLGGIVAFVIGAIMMFPSGTPGFELSPMVVAATVIATASLFLLVLASHVIFFGFLAFTRLGSAFYETASAVQSRASVWGQWEWWQARRAR